MRFEGTRPSGKDKDIPVYIFSMGKEEMKLILEGTKRMLMWTPQVLETMPTRGRMNNIRKVINDVLLNENQPKSMEDSGSGIAGGGVDSVGDSLSEDSGAA